MMIIESSHQLQSEGESICRWGRQGCRAAVVFRPPTSRVVGAEMVGFCLVIWIRLLNTFGSAAR